jgi:hypothetical protein
VEFLIPRIFAAIQAKDGISEGHPTITKSKTRTSANNPSPLGTPCCVRTEQSHTAMISRILFFLALVVLSAQVRSTGLCLACLRFDI